MVVTLATDISTNLENIPPCRDGRDPRTLVMDKEDIAHQQREFEYRIASDPIDPLKEWTAYIRWFVQVRQFTTKQCTKTIRRALETFLDAPLLYEDKRLLKIWILYADYMRDRLPVFEFLWNKQIGVSLSRFYIHWANNLERVSRFAHAREAYTMGKNRQAEPSEVLEVAQRDFEIRMTARGKLEIPADNNPHRQPMSRLTEEEAQSLHRPVGLQVRNNNQQSGVIGRGGPGGRRNGTRCEVYQDRPGLVRSMFDNCSKWDRFPTNERLVDIEDGRVLKMKDCPSVPQKSRVVREKIEVYCDEPPEEVDTVMLHTEEIRPWPFNFSVKVGDDVTSVEEVRAQHWKENGQTSEEPVWLETLAEETLFTRSCMREFQSCFEDDPNECPDVPWAKKRQLESNSKISSSSSVAHPSNALAESRNPEKASERRNPEKVETSERRNPEKVETSESRNPEKVETSEIRNPEKVETSERRNPEKVETSERRNPEKVETSERRNPDKPSKKTEKKTDRRRNPKKDESRRNPERQRVEEAVVPPEPKRDLILRDIIGNRGLEQNKGPYERMDADVLMDASFHQSSHYKTDVAAHPLESSFQHEVHFDRHINLTQEFTISSIFSPDAPLLNISSDGLLE